MANFKLATDPNWYGGAGAGYGQYMARKVVAFDGTANKGAVGVVPLFTVTGGVAFSLVAICTEDLTTGAGATISVGTPGAVTGLIGVTTGVDIDAGDIWFAAAPATKLDTQANAFKNYVIGDGADIQGNVLVDSISDGTIEFTLFWTPLTANGNVAVA